MRCAVPKWLQFLYDEIDWNNCLIISLTPGYEKLELVCTTMIDFVVVL